MHLLHFINEIIISKRNTRVSASTDQRMHLKMNLKKSLFLAPEAEGALI